MKNYKQLTLFIGQSIGNTDERLEVHQILTAFEKVSGISNFTFQKSTGVYQGQYEDSVIITVIDEYIPMSGLQIKKLATVLKQECILYTLQDVYGDLAYRLEV